MKMDLDKRNQNMRDFFNSHAPNNAFDDNHAPLMFTKTVLTQNLPEGTKRVLDLGAGTGLELISLFERFPDARVTAIDIAEKMLDVLRTRPFADRVEILCGDFFAMEFGEGYDAAISSSALHHFEAEPKLGLYKKVFASLREGGVFLNSDCVYSTQEQEDERFREFFTNGHNWVHCDTPLCVANEKKLLEQAGFVDFASTDLHDDQDKYKLIFARKP